jgi:hypothetical protein
VTRRWDFKELRCGADLEPQFPILESMMKTKLIAALLVAASAAVAAPAFANPYGPEPYYPSNGNAAATQQNVPAHAKAQQNDSGYGGVAGVTTQGGSAVRAGGLSNLPAEDFGR